MRLPRDVSGKSLVEMLARLGYAVSRQAGSHIRLTLRERLRPLVKALTEAQRELRKAERHTEARLRAMERQMAKLEAN